MTDNRADILNEEAAGWVVRLASDQRTRADEAEFKAWLNADPAHALAYAEHHALWSGVGGLADNEEARDILFPDRKTRTTPWTRRRALIGGIGTAAAAGLGAAIVTPRFFGPDRYATAPGEQRTLHLVDGSTVMLNTDSTLRVALGKAERRLFLDKGQAFFQVAKDRTRPFRVFVGAYEVRALGTAFDVRRVGDAARVTLEEGRVAIYHGDERRIETAPAMTAPAATLEPGQQAVLASAEPVSVAAVDVRKTEAWRTGQMILDETPLGDIVDDLNRYGGPQIVLADSKLAAIRVSGVFHTSRPDVFVDAVTTAFPVRVVDRSPDRIVLAPK